MEKETSCIRCLLFFMVFSEKQVGIFSLLVENPAKREQIDWKRQKQIPLFSKNIGIFSQEIPIISNEARILFGENGECFLETLLLL